MFKSSDYIKLLYQLFVLLSAPTPKDIYSNEIAKNLRKYYFIIHLSFMSVNVLFYIYCLLPG